MEDERIARPIDDEQALALARDLVAHFRPELTPEEQYAAALGLASSVKVVENHFAAVAELGRATDEAVVGQNGEA